MVRTPFLLSTLALSSALYAGNGYDGRFNLYTGWRQDCLDWSVQGPGGDPDVFAAIDWKEFESLFVGARGYLAGWDHIFIRAQADYGKFLQGKAINSVYAFNDRLGLFTRTEACQTGRLLYDYKLALGGHVLPNCGPFDVAFVGGYSYQSISLRFENPVVVLSPLMIDSRFGGEGLHVRNLAHWKSGFLGVDGYWNAGCWTFAIQGEFHYVAYKGRGQWIWNEPAFEVGIDEIAQYFDLRWRDCASGWGQLVTATIGYGGHENWYFGLVGGYQRFWTRPGDFVVDDHREHFHPDLTYIVTFPAEDAVLNKIVWESFYITFNFECHF